VLAGDAKAGALPALQFPFIDKTPFLHRSTSCLVHLYYFSRVSFASAACGVLEAGAHPWPGNLF
jgi:hypothetical protein